MEVIVIVTGPLYTNTYVVVNNGEAVVIDPGADAKCISEYVASKNAKIKHILLTHGHYDHIGAVAALKTDGAKVYMSRRDYEFYLSQKDNPKYANVVPFDMDVAVSDGDELTLAGYTFKVLETPGHTPGGVCFCLEDIIIFTGDTLFKQSIGRSDFEYGDSEQLVRSVKKLFDLPGDRSVLPGHGQDTTLDFERKNNPYVNY